MSSPRRPPIGIPPDLSSAAVVSRFAIIGLVVLGSAAAFAYTGGWLSPHRLTQKQMIAGFETVNGPHPGFRRNHAKGLCATGVFQSNGNAVSLSKAALFAPEKVPVVARFAFAGGMPFVPDDPSTVRSLALQFLPSGAEEWRTGMINIPVFPVNTAQAFYDQMLAFAPDPATDKADPAKMQAFAAGHPEFVAAVGLLKTRQVSSGFADTTYNALHTFRFINADGAATQVRWSAVPVQAPAPAGAPPADRNGLFDALIAGIAKQPAQWRLMLTVGQPGDTIDPTLPWPADRPQVDAGTVTLDNVSSEDSGPCIDVNYDPTVLPSGIEPSADPILSARSAAYARSFRLREREHAEKPASAITPKEVASGGKS